VSANEEELALLRDAARHWATHEAPASPEHRRDPAAAARRWRSMVEMGWPGVAVPEAAGGAGMGFVGMGVLLHELGRELVDAPLLASGLVGAQALAGQPQQADLLARVAAGTATLAVALNERAHHAPEVIETTAEPAAGGWRLHGIKRYVLNAAEADRLVVSARAGDGVALFVIDRARCGIEPLDTIDGRSCAHVVLDGVDVPPAGRLHGGAEAVQALDTWARLGMAAELLGAAERMLEITVDYLKTREQFGRRIGSFQALQHRAAQMYVAQEIARAAVEEAWAAADRGDAGLARMVLVAKQVAGDAAHLISKEIVQMHGGIGMTSEHVAGRYLKWTRCSEQHHGTGAWLARRYAELAGF